MDFEARLNKAYRQILKLEESNLNTKPTKLDLFDKLEPAPVGTAVQNESDDVLYISQTSNSLTESSSKQKEGLPAPTEQSLSPSWRQIPESASDYYSKQITGQPNYTEKGTLVGAPETGSTAPLAKSSPIRGYKIKLPTGPTERKKIPLWSGLVSYFPDALAAVAAVSYQGSKQHHPDKPLHWDRSKSTDHKDTLLRHLWESGTVDADGQRHSAKVVWRALAMLQLELECSANDGGSEHG